MNHRSIIAALIAGILLAGCSIPGNGLGAGVLGAGSPRSATEQSRGKSATLFVANGADVAIYDAQTGAYKKAICKGGSTVRSLFTTSNGYAIVGRPQSAVVSIYGGPRKRELQKIRIPHPIAMATDADGDLFILSVHKGKRVEVFAPGSSLPYDPTPVRTISSGVGNALNITVDTAGNLYVPNWGVNRGKNVTIYAPGSSTPTRTISQGISGPYAVALDPANNVYVSNDGSGTGEHGSVTVYAAGTTTLLSTITLGIAFPHSLAFDGSGNLYVANLGVPDYGGEGVTAYAPKTFNLIRTITSGIDSPGGIAFDNTGDLFVPNFYAAVTVYSPNSDMLTQTIAQNVLYPTSVSVQQ